MDLYRAGFTAAEAGCDLACAQEAGLDALSLVRWFGYDAAVVAVAPAPNKNDLAAMLAQATPEQQKQMLGERLYMLIVPTQSQLAGKITGMLLDGLDTVELLGLIDSPVALDDKIKLALDALQKHAKP